MEKIDTRKLKPEVQQQIRYLAIKLRKNGRKYKEISDILGVNLFTVAKWWRSYQKDGAQSIQIRKRGRRIGTCRTLTPDQEKQVQKIIVDTEPTRLKLPFALWNRMAIKQLIRQLWAIDMPIRTVGEYLRRWGFTPQLPIYMRGERDEDEIKRWKEEFKNIRNASKNRNAYLVFIDESGFMLSPVRIRSYAPRGQTPVIKVTDPHGRISVIAAITVSPVRQRANLIYSLSSDNANFNSQAVEKFLSQIFKRILNPITILWDSIPIHGSNSVKDFLNGYPGIVNENFPPYAPELNPVDRVWGYIKHGRLANYAPDGLTQLRSKVKQELSALKKKSYLLHAFIRDAGLDLGIEK